MLPLSLILKLNESRNKRICKEVKSYSLYFQLPVNGNSQLMAVLQTENGDEEYLKPGLVKSSKKYSIYQERTDKVGLLTLGKLSDN